MSSSSITPTGGEPYSYSTTNNQKEYTLPGVGPVPINEGEATTTELVEEYKRLLTIIYDIMNKEGELTEEDVNKLMEAVNELARLAKEGDTTTTPPSYMKRSMLEKLDAILSLLKTAGIEAGKTPDMSYVLEGLKLLKEYESKSGDGKTIITFNSILESAINIWGQDLYLDSMLMAIVMEATESIETKLNSLAKMLEISEKIADFLARLQSLRNRSVHAPEVPEWKDGQPIPPTEEITPELIEELMAMKKELESLIDSLEAEGILVTDEGSVTAVLKKVYDDLAWLPEEKEKIDLNIVTQIKSWLLDDKQFGRQAGSVQDNISRAMNVTQSFNDIQMQELQLAQFKYEQLCKLIADLMNISAKTKESTIGHVKGAG
jgi:hypothetical protein